MAEFTVSGGEKWGEQFQKFTKDVQRKVDLAAKTGKSRAVDLIMYGKVTNISERTITGGVIGKASKRLGIQPYHLYFRSFARGIKANKPYASGMIRTDSIMAVELLLSSNKSKAYQGYKTRKKGTNTNKAKKRKMANSRARAARRKIQGSGKLKVGKQTHSGVFIEDGTKRNNNNKFYMKNYGASSYMLKKHNNPMLIMTKKHKTQPKPYPTVALKLKGSEIHSEVSRVAQTEAKAASGKITDLQSREVNKRLKKLGFKLS